VWAGQLLYNSTTNPTAGQGWYASTYISYWTHYTLREQYYEAPYNWNGYDIQKMTTNPVTPGGNGGAGGAGGRGVGYAGGALAGSAGAAAWRRLLPQAQAAQVDRAD
jgi:hypothetical protein